MSFKQTEYVIGFVGPRGSGKSGFMSYMITRWGLANGIQAWTNYPVETRVRKDNVVYHLKSNPLDQSALYGFSQELNKGIVAIDELGLFADARRSNSINNRLLSYILQQTRKRTLSFYFSVQNLAWVDNRIRWIMDVMVVCKDLSFTPWGKSNHLKRGEIIQVRGYDLSGMLTGKPMQDVMDKKGYSRPAFCKTLYGPKSFWHLYNTDEIQDPFEAQQKLEVKQSKQTIDMRSPEEIEAELLRKAKQAEKLYNPEDDTMLLADLAEKGVSARDLGKISQRLISRS